MKKLLLAIFTMMACVSCVIDVEEDPGVNIIEKSYDKVYFLDSPSCGYSAAAKKYITETYPDLPVEYFDIDLEKNRRFLKAAKYEYHLGSGNISTPIICLGVNCITGWDYHKRELLDIYIQPYLDKMTSH